MKTDIRQVRQGDVLITRVEDGAKTGKELPRDQGRIVLAYGEVTGHAHAIADREATLYERPPREDRGPDGDAVWAAAQRILRAQAPVTLRHEEHGAIPLPPGTYEVTRQREYSPEELRMVLD